MEKLMRLIGDGPVTAPIYNSLLGVIEALEARLGDAEHLLRCHTDNHQTTTFVGGNGGDLYAGGLFAKITAHERALRDTGFLPPDPAEVILAQRDKLMSILRDKGMRVWTQALTSIFVAALRDAGRDDDE